MPAKKSSSGPLKYTWVAAGKSDVGKKRTEWWEQKKIEYKKKGVILSEDSKLSPIAYALHPTKKKNCQTCGSERDLGYIYPNKLTLNKLNNIFSLDLPLYTEQKGVQIKNIFMIIEDIFSIRGLGSINDLNKIFNGVINCKNLNEIKFFIKEEFVIKKKNLSPGFMSNPPDRFDGFHDYAICCRSEQDTGRHSSNLSKYGEDRRAYEKWADGDWKTASWLMKEFAKNKLSADHIGPISLGFSQIPHFQPMSKSQNSSKGNRLRFSDVVKLISLEAKGVNVVSWHSKQLWDKVKFLVKNDDNAKTLSALMAQNLHDVLTIFSSIKNNGGEELLKSFLNPQFAFYSIEIIGFDSSDGSYKEIKKIKGNRKEYSRNAERYIRISLDELDNYVDKNNRKKSNLDTDYLEEITKNVLQSYKTFGILKARNKLLSFFNKLAEKAKTKYINLN